MLSVSVFAFGSPKDKKITMWHWGGGGGRKKIIENYLKILNGAKWCSGLQMPVLLVLWGLLREQMRHSSTLPCFTCFKVRLYSSCPLLLPVLAGGSRAIWERDPECLHVVTIQGEQLSVSMRAACILWLSEESCLIYRVLFGGKEEASWLSVFLFSGLRDINLKNIHCVCVHSCWIYIAFAIGLEK